MAGEAPVRIPRMDWIDYLRMACAGVVLLDHLAMVVIHPKSGLNITGFGLLTEIGRYGNIALYIFFLMSGMMITLVAQTQSAATFLTHRATRVYPMFVLCLTITCIVTMWSPIAKFHATPVQYLANLTLDPMAFGQRWVDASYWTLPVETTFYGAMILVMALGAMKHLQKIIAVWIALQALTCWFMWDVPLIGYTYYFLAAGSVLALLYQRVNEKLNYALLGLALIPCLRCIYEISHRAQFNFWIGSAVLLLALALFLFMRGREFSLPGAQRIGSLTYPLYLLHFHIGITLLGWWINESNKWLVLPAVLALLIAAAALLDDVIEFRMRPVWRRLFGATIARPVAWLEARTGSPSATLR